MTELYNGDCLDVMKQMNDCSVDCIVSDVPYGVDFKNGNYDDSHENVKNNMQKWTKEMYRVLKDNGFCYLFVGIKTIHEWISCCISSGFNYKNIIATSSYHSDKIRSRNNFNFQFQPIILLSKGNGRKLNNVDFIPTSESWIKDKRNKNPKKYTYDYPDFIKPEWCFSTIKRKKHERYHPNEKNYKLVQFFIELSSNEKEVVLDPFMGSGTTGVACKISNRNFIGIELNSKYFNVAKERIESELL